MYGLHKKASKQEKWLTGVPKRERRHSSFLLDALVVVEMDEAVDQIVGFMEGSRLKPVDTFGFEDGEEVSAIAGSEGVAYDVLMFEADTFLNTAPMTANFLHPLLEGHVELRPVSSLLWDTADAVIRLSEQHPMQAVGYVYQLLFAMMETCVIDIRPSGAADQRFREIVKCVNAHYTEPLIIALLSESFGYDEAYFCRRFKKTTGLTILSYIEVLRWKWCSACCWKRTQK